MADETPQGVTPDDAAEGAMPDADSPDATPEPTFDIEGAKALIKNLRPHEREAKRLAKELKDAQQALKAREDADLSEVEKLKRDLTTVADERTHYQSQLRELRAKDAVVSAAALAIKPDAIWRMLRTDVEFDDDGQPANIKALVDGVKRDFPELFRSANGNADGGVNGRAVINDDMNTRIRAELRR